MHDLKDLLGPLSQQQMPDRWSEIQRRELAPLSEPNRGSRLATYALSLAAAALVLLIVTALWQLGGLKQPSLRFDSPPTPVVSALDARVAQRVDIGATAGSVAAADGSVWFATYDFHKDAAAVVHIDAATASVINTIPIDGLAYNIAAGDGAAWVTVNPPHGDPMLVRIDQGTDEITGTLLGVSGPIVVDATGVWAVEGTDLVRIDPASLAVTARLPLGASPFDIAAGGGVIWVLEREDHGDVASGGPLVRVDPTTATVSETVPLSIAGIWIAASEDGVWVNGWRPDDPHTSAAFFVPTSDLTPQDAADIYNFRPFGVAEGRIWFLSGPNDPGLPKGGVCGLNVQTHIVDACAAPRSIADLELAHDPAAYDPVTNTLWVGEYESPFVSRIDIVSSGTPSASP